MYIKVYIVKDYLVCFVKGRYFVSLLVGNRFIIFIYIYYGILEYYVLLKME